MNKLFLGVVALAIAASASAFTSAKDYKTLATPVTYKNIGDGVYSRLVSLPCTEEDAYQCEYFFENESNATPSVDQFDSKLPAQIPTDLGPGTQQGNLLHTN